MTWAAVGDYVVVVVDSLFYVSPIFEGVLCWSLFGMHYFMSILVLQSS